MTKSLTFFLALLLTVGMQMDLSAQLKTPAPSPLCKMTQTVGLTDITVEYSRPGVKDREIFSSTGLVPYGEMWRTGANKNTMITFGDDVKVAGQDVKKGSYALFTIPGEKEWTIILYMDTNNWGLPENWDAEKEAARFTVKASDMPFSVETFFINIGNIESSAAKMHLIWEKTIVSIPIEVDVDSKVMNEFEKLVKGPSQSDYYRMASYYHETGKDLNEALGYIEKATSGTDVKFWQVRRKSLILADMGKYKEAIAAAKQSLQLATEAGNNDYVRMNEKAIKEWSMK